MRDESRDIRLDEALFDTEASCLELTSRSRMKLPRQKGLALRVCGQYDRIYMAGWTCALFGVGGLDMCLQ